MIIPIGYSHPVNIGKGSFSSVYRVYQKKLARHVVLKIISLKHVTCSTIIEKEVRTLGSMRLPSVPHIYDVRRSGSQIIIVMEWIYGIPLSVLNQQTISASTRMSLAGDIIHALATIHSAGIVHRDVKPENIIITPDRGVVFVDFGFSVSNIINSDKSKHMLQGTPAYMAPELWIDNEVKDYHKTDLYSLGILLKDLLGNSLPDIAHSLFNTNPSLRPLNCTSFEKEWLKLNLPLNTDSVSAEVSYAVADFTANLLFESVHELYEKNRKEEAYSLLTESLEIWPDNPAALDFLQYRFSLSLSYHSRKLFFTWAITVCITLAALAGAFLIGVYSSSSSTIPDNFLYAQNEHQNMLLLLHNNSPQLPVTLRDISVKGNLVGSLTVLLPDARGSLFIDEQIRIPNCKNSFSTSLPEGTHRIEWFDSIQNRCYGETVHLKPFSMKTISLQRFSYVNH